MIDDLPSVAAGRPQLVAFDIVGTILEDGDQVPDAFLGALRAQHVAVTATELQPWRGASKRQVLRAFLERYYEPGDPGNAGRLESAYADFRQRLEASYRDGGVTPIPGVEATFAWLREQGIQIALTTGLYRRVTDLVLQAAGWQQGVVDATICSDEVAQGRPAPYLIFRAMEATGVTDVRRVAAVGDTALDLLAGTHAGVRWVIGVLPGSGRSGGGARQAIETLGMAPHTHILSSVAVLPRLWP
jgi:phosphonatase-like hydrolase